MKDALQKNVQPYVARMISSMAALKLKRHFHEIKRRVLAQPHHVEIYLRINDPYSYLLVQVLAEVEQRFSITTSFKTIQQLQADMYPEAEMWHDNGFIDASHLADLYQLDWPSQAPDPATVRVRQGCRLLLHIEARSQANNDRYWSDVEEVYKKYWFQQSLDEIKEGDLDESAWERQLLANEQALAEKGHYMSAMMLYGGEWYWGLDRLDHLERRLNQRGLGDNQVRFNKTYGQLCQSNSLKAPNSLHKKLTLYFSIRSPYSHLGLQQAITMAKHYQISLDIKPVLPMVMRGLSVPKTKKMYIFHDTKREAQKLGIDYGFVADPLGEGVNRCYSLFKYAQSLGCEQEYLLHYAQAVNAQGIRSETDAGLKIIVERSGLDWNHAQQLLQQPDCEKEWQVWAEENRQQMVALGSWGVPTLQYGDLVLWGQDRVGLIERAILRDYQEE
jgi:2-hydroxychromene-2-carboxylate isomerase